MPDNIIDTLSIDIKSNSAGASKAINNLITNLTRLNGALNNYSDASEYNKALGNLQSGFKGLNSAIVNLDTEKLRTVASSISSIASSAKKLNGVFNNVGLDKATRDAKAMDSQIEKATRDIMSFYGTSRNVADSVGKSFKEVMSGATIKDGRIADLTNEGWKEFDNLFRTISRNAQKSAVEGGNAYYQELVDYMRGRKIPVHLPFDFSDISGDISDARSKLATVFGVGGWSFNSKETGDISEFVKEMNEALGTQFDTSNDVSAFNDLYNALSQARRELSGFSQATTTIDVDMDEFVGVVSNAVNSVRQFDSQVSNASSTAQTNPFSAMADGLRGLQGISIPNLSGVADIAGNIGKLANKKASAGIQMLPTLSSGLQSLNSLQGITVPDLTGLAELIAVIGKLGGKKGNNATSNLRPMISGLQQLSSLSGISFPDSTNLASLANAFSMLGRATTGNAIQNIPQLATAFRQLMQTLSTAPRVSQNVIDLANALAKLSSNGAKVGTASRSLNTGMQKINSAFDGVMQRSKAISTRIMDFGKKLLLSGFHADSTGRRYETLASKIGLLYAKFWVLIRAVKGLNGMIEVASSLTEVQNVVDTTFGKMSGKLEEFAKNSIKDFGMSELSAKQYASQFQAMGVAMGITGQQVQKAQQYLNTKRTLEGSVAGYDKASKSMADMSINLTKLSADMASFYDIEQETVAKALQSGVMAGQTRPLRQFGLDLTQSTLQSWALSQGLDADVKSMTQAEKTMLRYQYVMANSTRAQQDFQRTQSSWHNQVVMLKQQLQQLAAVIGSGLIQAIKPFVTQMNAALGGLIKFAQNVINALGKIFGWEMEINTKGLTLDEDMLDVDTSGLDGIGDSADDSAKSVKKLKDQLQGFDKLNVLRAQTKTPKSGSGSGNGTGASGIGAVDGGDVTAGLKKTKSMFESEIDNLFDLGRYISDSLSKQLEKIPWNTIYEKASGFGRGLAEFLNGLITPRLFADVGRTVSDSINTAFEFLNSFGQTFSWDNFGQSIGYGINAFLHGFNWGTILSSAKEWGKGLATTINNAVATTSFSAIGRTLANAFKTILTYLENFASTLEWGNIGKKLADGINGFVKDFPAAKLARTINKWVQGIYDLIVSALSNIKWSDVRDKIVEFIKNLDFKTVSIILKTLALIKGASFTISIAKAIMDAVAKKFVENLATSILAEMAASPLLSKVLGKGLGDAATKAAGSGFFGTASGGGIIATIGGIGAAIAGLGLTSKGFFSLWDKGWNISGGLMTTAGTGITLAGLGIAGVLTGPLALAIAGATGGFALFAANHEKIVDGMKTKGKEFSDSCKKFFSTDMSVTAKDFGDHTTKMNSDFDGMGTAISTKAGEIKDKVSTSWENTKIKTSKSWSGVKTDISNAWSGIKTNTGTALETLKTNASSAWTNIKSNASIGVGNIKTVVSNKFSNIKTSALNAIRPISKGVSDIWNDIIKKAPTEIGKIRDKIYESFNKLIKKVAKIFPLNLKKLFDFKLPTFDISTRTITILDRQFTIPSSVGVKWNKQAYANPLLFGSPTVLPTAAGYQGFGDGNGGELVYGHKNLMNDIRAASGSNEMTNIGNRQLANDQRIIQLLTIIAEKEFGITADQVFRSVRNQAEVYEKRTGRGAFQF